MSNTSVIYKITSPTGKIYIGETVNFEKRFKRYKSLQCKSQFKLYNSFMKYGVESHIFEIIESCDIDNLKCRERYYQDYFDCLSEKGLNLKLTSCSELKQTLSEESIKKTNTTKRERKVGVGENNPMFGKTHSELTKLKISIANKDKLTGNKNPMYGKKGKEHPAYGTKRDEEYLKLASINNSYGRNPMSKVVLDTQTGIFYESASELANLLKINKYTLRSRLNGSLKNNTNFTYC